MITVPVDELPLSKIEKPKLFNITSNGISSYTHGFFKYPCKFIPHIPRWALNRYLKDKNSLVLDPFCGSGTTLVESALFGCSAIGVDFDPFSQLITRVKSTPLNKNQFIKIRFKLSILFKHLDALKIIDEDLIPAIPNIDLWFSRKACQDLARIKQSIGWFIRDSDVACFEDFLEVCFGSIIRKVSFADNQSPKPYVSGRIKKIPENPIEIFKKTVLANLSKLEEFSHNAKSNSNYIYRGDARHLDRLRIKQRFGKRVDLAVTSPPYINAFDYVRSLKLENLWLDLLEPDELKEHTGNQIGTERVQFDPEIVDSMKSFSNLYKIFQKIGEVDPKRANIVMKYFYDMRLNMLSVKNILKPNGVYCIVVGDSQIRNIEIATYKYFIQIAEQVGFEVDSLFGYVIKNPYLRFPRKGRGGLIKIDWVIALRKCQ